MGKIESTFAQRSVVDNESAEHAGSWLAYCEVQVQNDQFGCM